MALQSSGPISLSDIATEQGISTTNMSLRSMSNTAGFATPDAITEFYGYSAGVSNTNYWEFSNAGEGLVFQRAAGTTLSTGVDMCVSFWFRPEWGATDVNAMLYEFTNSATAVTDRFFLLYDYGLNRLVARLRTNSGNSRGTHWNLNSNSSQTGISSGAWHSGNVGNVNSDGLAHIVITYDSSASTGQAAFDCYWNGVKMPNKITNLTTTIFNYQISHLAINRPPSSTGSARESQYDNFAFFHNKMLSQSEITALYNSGTSLIPSEVNEDDNVAFLFDAENDPPTAVSGDDYTTTWTNTVDSGSAIAY